VFRGNKKRTSIQPFLTLRRQFMSLRRAEEATRNSSYYHSLLLVGLAPPLASDTTLEKVLKAYPGYMHHVLEFCLQGNWTLACDLLNEHNEYLRNNAIPSNAVMTYLSKRRVRQLAKVYHASLGLYLDRHKAYIASKALYQHSKSDPNTNATVLKRLKEKYERSSKEVERAKSAKEKAQRKKEAAELDLTRRQVAHSYTRTLIHSYTRTLIHSYTHTLMHSYTHTLMHSYTHTLVHLYTYTLIHSYTHTLIQGPQGLQKLVKSIRTHGLLMPFTVSIKQYRCVSRVLSNSLCCGST